jgi:hypothetical protein
MGVSIAFEGAAIYQFWTGKAQPTTYVLMASCALSLAEAANSIHKSYIANKPRETTETFVGLEEKRNINQNTIQIVIEK